MKKSLGRKYLTACDRIKWVRERAPKIFFGVLLHLAIQRKKKIKRLIVAEYGIDAFNAFVQDGVAL